MGRPLSNDIASVWHRHSPGCRSRTTHYVGPTAVYADGRTCSKCRSQQCTRELRWHSFMTSLEVTSQPLMFGPVEITPETYKSHMEGMLSFVCPTCLERVSTTLGQVDRVKAGGDYAPGNVTMICMGCNNARGHDLVKLNLRAYRRDVMAGSKAAIEKRGLIRGPSAFNEEMISMIKGSQSRKVPGGIEQAEAMLSAGPYKV